MCRRKAVPEKESQVVHMQNHRIAKRPGCNGATRRANRSAVDPVGGRVTCSCR
jgi:hypothetical protein